MIHILFVCLGNICRSPLAQGIFEKKIEEEKIADKFYIDSAGTSGWHENEKPHYGSIQIARLNDIDLTKQRARRVKQQDAEHFDYFISMDESNKISLINDSSLPKEKVLKMRSFDPDHFNMDVPDPYGMGSGAFQDVFNILDRSNHFFLKFLKEKHKDILASN